MNLNSVEYYHIRNVQGDIIGLFNGAQAGDSILHSRIESPDNISWDLGGRKGYYNSKIIYFAVSN